MVVAQTLFQRFGGIRPMARALGLPSSNVCTWKSEGRIPSKQQAHVLAVGQALGLPITTDDVVFPLGRPAEVLGDQLPPVACDRAAEAQRRAGKRS